LSGGLNPRLTPQATIATLMVPTTPATAVVTAGDDTNGVA
jgi:hypothetical protein